MSNSWIHLKENQAKYQLSEGDKKHDAINAIDCGWVEQMRPFIRQFSQSGELVLDPFCGFASTLVASELEGRRGIGIEIDKNRVKLSQKRLDSLGFNRSVIIQGNTQKQIKTINSVDLILTNIPYFGCTWQDENSNQLYNAHNYEVYLQKLRACIKEFKQTLKYSGYIILMVENIRIGDHFVPLAMDVLSLLRESFYFIDERVLIYDKDVAEPNAVLSNRAHESVLIAQNIEIPIDLNKSKKYLRELCDFCPEAIVYGSFSSWLLNLNVIPSDIDMFLPYDVSTIKSVAEWFLSNGFKVTRWGVPVSKKSLNSAILVSNYLRAELLNIDGSLVIFDISFSDKIDLYKRMLSKSVLIENIICMKESVTF